MAFVFRYKLPLKNVVKLCKNWQMEEEICKQKWQKNNKI
jgi:hypothetical protein